MIGGQTCYGLIYAEAWADNGCLCRLHGKPHGYDRFEWTMTGPTGVHVVRDKSPTRLATVPERTLNHWIGYVENNTVRR